MRPAREPKSLLRAVIGVVSLIASLIVIPIGFVLLIVNADPGNPSRSLRLPVGVLMAGGGLLALGIAMLIWELSVRYDIRR
jgi:hypothetical protein